MTNTSNNNYCQYISTYIIFGICFVFLIQSIAVVIDYDETQTYINNTCLGIGNFSIKHWNLINNRAVTSTVSIDSNQNITLYYPSVDVWVFWEKSEGREWYEQLKSTVNSNKTFPCYVDYPENIGITHHLNQLWFYYMISIIMFIVCGSCIIYACIERTYVRKSDYYRLQ